MRVASIESLERVDEGRTHWAGDLRADAIFSGSSRRYRSDG
jgi:hypothetical protein